MAVLGFAVNIVQPYSLWFSPLGGGRNNTFEKHILLFVMKVELEAQTSSVSGCLRGIVGDASCSQETDEFEG